MTDTAGPSSATTRTVAASLLARLGAVCAVIPYALVALGLRLVMARLFFLSGPGLDRGAAGPDPRGHPRPRIFRDPAG
jgi:hypothetical protein